MFFLLTMRTTQGSIERRIDGQPEGLIALGSRPTVDGTLV
jgi:hypothetical protein